MYKKSSRILPVFLVFLLVVTLYFGGNISSFAVNALGTSRAVSTVQVSTESELRSAVSQSTGRTEIIIAAAIHVTDTVVIPSGADIIFSANSATSKIFASSAFSQDHPLIMVEAGASFTIGGDSSTHNLVLSGNGRLQSSVIKDYGQMVLNRGTITKNAVNTTKGGGVEVFASATFTMNGGEITDNKSSLYGGGIYIYSAGEFTMNGGKISGNLSNVHGGGIYAGKNSILTINNCEITENTAIGHGGGLAVYTEYSKIEAGTFRKNTAKILGGGIYIDNDLPLTVTNVFISNNSASRGGGLWLCSRGGAAFKMTENIALVKNTASYSGDDFFSDKKLETHSDIKIYLTDHMLGDASIQWFNDTHTARYNDGFRTTVPAGAKPTDKNIALHVEADNDDIDVARSMSTIFITENVGEYGGGIANNGMIVFGLIDPPDPEEPEPSEPEPSEPEPSEPEPSEPEPSEPEPSEPEPSEPEPSEPEPSEPEPSEPEPSEPEPSEPETSEPEPSELEPSKPEPSKPEPSKPEPSKPEPSKPEISRPETSRPKPSTPGTSTQDKDRERPTSSNAKPENPGSVILIEEDVPLYSLPGGQTPTTYNPYTGR